MSCITCRDAATIKAAVASCSLGANDIQLQLDMVTLLSAICESSVTTRIRCFEDDTLGDGTVIVPFSRNYLYDPVTGLFNLTSTVLTADGVTPYTPVGTETEVACDSTDEEAPITVQKCFEDDTLGDGTVIVRFLRVYEFDEAAATFALAGRGSGERPNHCLRPRRHSYSMCH